MTFEATIQLDLERPFGPVHRYLYGANLEHIGESIYGGVWAEMLRSPKFAGPDPIFMSIAEGGGNNHNAGVVMPWEAVNPDYARVICDHDNTHVYVRPRYQTDAAVHKGIHPPAGLRGVWTPQQSQRITIRAADGSPHGIAQRGLRLEAGRPYQLRLVLKGEGQAVTVTLGDQTWQLPAVSADWATVTQTLVPGTSDDDGALSITFTATGTLWVARASLMPADHVHGFRPDVLDAIRDQWTPTFLRWPGGNLASAYHWQDGVGDRDRRPPYLDPAWQTWETHDVGTDEFITLCRLLDSEPILTINMGTGTPAEAAAWVEYCNGGPETRFGRLRAAHGHPEPFDVRTWFVGNEQFGNWQDGHCDAETYAHRYLDFAAAMRAVDPNLTLLAVGVPTDQHSHWNARVLEIIGDRADMLSFHWYSIRTMRDELPPAPEDLVVPQLAAAHEIDFILRRTLEIVAAHGDPPLPLAFDEWNTYIRAKPPHFLEDYNLADALFTGGVMNACLRLCDRVQMSAPFNFTNVMGNYRITPGGVWWTPATLVMKLLTEHRGAQSLPCAVTSPTFASPAVGQQLAYDAVPLVDAAATFDPKRRIVYLSMVNNALTEAATIALPGIARRGAADVYRVTAASPVALNTEVEKDAVTIEQSTWAADTLVLPPISFTLLCIELEEA